MDQQQLFAGLKYDPRPRDRLLLAIRPPPEIAILIAALASRLRVDLRLTGPPLLWHRLHITLWSFKIRAGIPDALKRSVMRAMDLVAAPSFEVAFDCAQSFSNKTANLAFTLRAAEDASALIAFRETIRLALARAGLVYDFPLEYIPHVTMLYDDVYVPKVPVPPLRWTVKDFVLIHSMVGKTRHIELGHWLLDVDGNIVEGRITPDHLAAEASTGSTGGFLTL